MQCTNNLLVVDNGLENFNIFPTPNLDFLSEMNHIYCRFICSLHLTVMLVTELDKRMRLKMIDNFNRINKKL